MLAQSSNQVSRELCCRHCSRNNIGVTTSTSPTHICYVFTEVLASSILTPSVLPSRMPPKLKQQATERNVFNLRIRRSSHIPIMLLQQPSCTALVALSHATELGDRRLLLRCVCCRHCQIPCLFRTVELPVEGGRKHDERDREEDVVQRGGRAEGERLGKLFVKVWLIDGSCFIKEQ